MNKRFTLFAGIRSGIFIHGSAAAEVAPDGTEQHVQRERKCGDRAGRSPAGRLDLLLDKVLALYFSINTQPPPVLAVCWIVTEQNLLQCDG